MEFIFFIIWTLCGWKGASMIYNFDSQKVDTWLDLLLFAFLTWFGGFTLLIACVLSINWDRKLPWKK